MVQINQFVLIIISTKILFFYRKKLKIKVDIIFKIIIIKLINLSLIIIYN